MNCVICSPNPPTPVPGQWTFALLAPSPKPTVVGSVGTRLPESVRRAGLQPGDREWDFLALALSVIAADTSCPRAKSPDGWTRQIDLDVAVRDPAHWSQNSSDVENALRFLTGDLWTIRFSSGGAAPPKTSRRVRRHPAGDYACLLSGGTDSLVGVIDAVSAGGRPYVVSQVAQGDGDRQRQFAFSLGGLGHLQLTHATHVVSGGERTQRARSMIFLAYGVLAATSLPQYRTGRTVDLVVPENGFISLNIPLTSLRLGSLSTRTTHPHFIRLVQTILDRSGIRVRLVNPYQFKTKGEMLRECLDQAALRRLLFCSTSCGRFARFTYRHCGRCVPCLVRRAAIRSLGITDATPYRYSQLSLQNRDHRDFDDVRSAAMAVLQVRRDGVELWAGSALSAAQLEGNLVDCTDVARRGIDELDKFLVAEGVL